MWTIFSKTVFIIAFTKIQAKEPELPLCPTNMQYFPQNLPMHCRMPVGSMPPGYQNNEGKQSLPIPMPMPGLPGGFPGVLPGLPGGFPGALPGLPGSFAGAMPGGTPGGKSVAMPMPMPMMPMPMPPGPAQKLPVIVMPFYSQDTSSKTPTKRPRHKKPKRRPRPFYSSDDDSTLVNTDTSIDDSSDKSSDVEWWNAPNARRRSNRHRSKRRRHQRRPLLTPVLQYVTKDGYVIYEKQISKGEAHDWLGDKNVLDTPTNKNKYDRESGEPKNNVDSKILVKEEHGEVTTEVHHRLNHKKKSFKRRQANKHENKR